jgi:hypothetical protein
MHDEKPLHTLLDLCSFCSVAAYSLQAFVLKCPLEVPAYMLMCQSARFTREERLLSGESGTLMFLLFTLGCQLTPQHLLLLLLQCGNSSPQMQLTAKM